PRFRLSNATVDSSQHRRRANLDEAGAYGAWRRLRRLPQAIPGVGQVSLSTTIRVPVRFTASHSLAVREEMHPHEYTVVLELTGPVDPNSGFVVDMGEVRRLLEPLVQQLDGTTLNNNPALIAAGSAGAMAARFPTCECLAAYFATALKQPVSDRCGAAHLTAVEVILG